MIVQIVFLLIATLLVLCATTVDGLEVFLMAHSHIDQGWLNTVNEYRTDVYYILDSVTRELQKNGNRKFVWGEVLYFKDWYEMQPEEVKKIMRHLIETKRFEICHGGYIENDYANPSYTSVINQMTLGYEYLKDRFGITPRFAWDIDPFGYGGRIASLYAQMGIDALVINRVHWKIKEQMKQGKGLEFIWQIGNHNIFTNVLHTHYSAPKGFDFENGGVPHITASNVAQRAQALVSDLRNREKHYQTDHLLVPFGDDFKFKNAATQYKNMDQLVEYINKNIPGVHIRYATVGEYFDSLKKNHPTTEYPVVKHDFLPYADNEDSYWTGHYSTLPNLKKIIRDGEAHLNSVEKLTTYTKLLMETNDKLRSTYGKPILTELNNKLVNIRQNVAVVQHHDSITGTCRKHVARDYTSRMQQAISQSTVLSRKMIKIIMEEDPSSSTVLSPSEDIVLTKNSKLSLIVHNPLAHSRTQLIKIRSETSDVDFFDNTNMQLVCQVVPRVYTEQSGYIKGLSNSIEGFDVYVQVNVRGFALMKINVQTGEGKELHEGQFEIYGSDSKNPAVQPKEGTLAKISNNVYEIAVSSSTGYIDHVIQKYTSEKHPYPHMFTAYHTTNSGSYIFRPQGPPNPIPNKVNYVYKVIGPLFEMIIANTERVTSIIMLPYELDDLASEYIFLEFQLATIPGNTELMLNLGMKQKNVPTTLMTFDGLNFMKRKVSNEQPEAGRFYPAPAGAMLRSSESSLTMLVDHTMGVTTRGPDQLNAMIHRRLNRDDGRGMAQGNQDDAPLRTKMVISYESLGSQEQSETISDFVNYHSMSHGLNNPYKSYLSDQEGKFRSSFSIFNDHALPKEMQIISFDAMDTVGDKYVLRIHNLNPSKPQTIELSSLFTIPLMQVHRKTLNLAWNFGKKELNGFKKRPGSVVFENTKQMMQANSDSQNTGEMGVFLSDDAMAKAGGRQLLSSQLTFTYSINPSDIASFIVTFSEENSPSLIEMGGSLMTNDEYDDDAATFVDVEDDIEDIWKNQDPTVQQEEKKHDDVDDISDITSDHKTLDGSVNTIGKIPDLGFELNGKSSINLYHTLRVYLFVLVVCASVAGCLWLILMKPKLTAQYIDMTDSGMLDINNLREDKSKFV